LHNASLLFVQDELIGVAFLYLDPVQYLLDIHNSIPIINYSGKTAGTIHVRVRSWIDRMDTQPSYISIDKEANITDFVNHMCLIRIHVDNMRHLPKNLCSATYVTFKFFFHSAVYKTPRYCGSAINPAVEFTVAVDQKITRDFIDFVRSGSIEMEVFGKRHDPVKAAAAKPPAPIGEPIVLQLRPDDPAYSPSQGSTSLDGSLFEGITDPNDPDNASLGSVGNNNAANEEESEKDRLIAYLQHQVEELSTESAKKDKVIAQSKRTLNAAQMDKLQADIRADRSLEEKAEAVNKVAKLEAALAAANARVEQLSKDLAAKETAPPTTMVVQKSAVCTVS
jgi:hypothetical protein